MEWGDREGPVMPLDIYDETDEDDEPTVYLTQPVTEEHLDHDEQIPIGQLEPPLDELIHYPIVRHSNRVT